MHFIMLSESSAYRITLPCSEAVDSTNGQSRDTKRSRGGCLCVGSDYGAIRIAYEKLVRPTRGWRRLHNTNTLLISVVNILNRAAIAFSKLGGSAVRVPRDVGDAFSKVLLKIAVCIIGIVIGCLRF